MSNTSMNTSYGLHRDGSGTLQNLQEFLNSGFSEGATLFDNVAAITSSSTLEGTLIRTKGYYAEGDGGAAVYLNRGSSWPVSADGFWDLEDASGNFLEFQLNKEATPEQGGYDGTNAGTVINAAFVNNTQNIPIRLNNNQEYIVDTPILIRPNISITGGGNKLSGLVRADAMQGNVIDTFDFDALQAAQEIDVNNGVPSNFVLRGFYILGAKDTYPVSVTADTGYGARIYGKLFIIDDLRIHDTANIGLYTELSSVGNISPFDPFENAKPGYIHNLFIYNTDYEGFIFKGPTDIEIDQVFIGWPAGSLGTPYNPALTSLYYPGETVDGFVMDNAGAEVGFIHVFDNNNGWGTNLRSDSGAQRVKAQYIMNERCFGCLRIGENTRYQFDMLDTHNNVGGDGSRPHIEDNSTVGGVATNVEIFRGGDELGSDCLVLNGFNGQWRGNIYSNTIRSGHGVDLNGNGYNITMTALNLQGTNFNGQVSSGLVVRDGTRRNKVDMRCQNCDRNFQFQSSTQDYESEFNLNSVLPNIAHFFNVDNMNTQQYNSCLLIESDGVSTTRNRGIFSTQIPDLSLSGTQTYSIPYDLVRQPGRGEIRYSLAADGGTVSLPSIERIFINTISASDVDITIEWGAGGSGTALLSIEV